MKKLLQPMSALLAVCMLFFSACSRDAADIKSAPDAYEVTFIAVVPETSPAVYVTGNLPALGDWDPSLVALSGEGAERRLTIQVPADYRLEYKFTLGTWDQEAAGPSGTIFPNFELLVDEDKTVRHEIVDFKRRSEEYDQHIADWQGSGVLGSLVYWKDVPSSYLSHTRHVEIWLPPGYDDHPEKRYRVIYMSDGQNLFDPRIANTGVDWGIDEAMMNGVAAGQFEPAIVVATWSSPRRIQEYSPWHDAPDYAKFLVEELMPRVNAEFRTLTGPENTFHMGSSMGGLLSYYLVKTYPEVFSACGCVSSHFPISEALYVQYVEGGSPEGVDARPYIIRDIASGATMPPGQRLFFDYGTEGLDAEYGPTHAAMREWLAGQGYVEGEDFVIREYAGANHNERSWRARIGDQLQWLLAAPDEN